MLYEGIVNRVLVLCPSITIEKGLTKKFEDLSSNSDLKNSLPKNLKGKTPRIINADSTIVKGDICIENIHAVYSNTGSSIEDSFKNGGEDTLVLNDESHHIFNKTSEKGESGKNIKKWKDFLLDKTNNFKYILGFTGTAYVDNEYFNDVIYRYSLKQAIEDKIVKSIEYVQKDDIVSDEQYKFQKILQNHNNIKRKYSKIKPISILITKDISSAKRLYEDFIDFLCNFTYISRETAEKKVLIVTSDARHKSNIAMLDFVDSVENSYEWIVSVSMLTEGWDVKNVFQIIPWEDRAFNSKLLIAQVLGRGLRLPLEYTSPQPAVIVFNHDNWSKNIKSLVNEVLEIETKIISTVNYTGERNKYNFGLKTLLYDKEERETHNSSSTKSLDYGNSWKDGIKLKSQILSSSKETEYQNLLTGAVRNAEYNIQLRTRTVDDVLNKIYTEFKLRDWESNLLGLGDDEVYSKDNLPPRDKLEKIIRISMKNAGISGDVLIEENANKIFTAFSTLFRRRNTYVVYEVKFSDLKEIKTINMNDENRGLSSFRSNEAMLFYTDKYLDEAPSKEQSQVLEEFINDETFPKQSSTQINFHVFKTPLNVVIANSDPEYIFLKKYFFKRENVDKIKTWIKSRDVGFYTIEYSYKVNTHTKIGSFNPDFFIVLNKEHRYEIIVVEIKQDGDVSLENKGKYKAAKEHFNLLNKKLVEENIQEEYYFHFLSPKDYEVFFEYLREGKIDTFVSELDNLLEE